VPSKDNIIDRKRVIVWEENSIKQSIRLKLSLLFLITIVIPVIIILIALPAYYLNLVKEQESTLLEGTLTALTFDIDTYLDDLERMTVTPYLNPDVMRALKLKSTGKVLTPAEQIETEESLSKTLPKFLRNLRKDILGTILLPMDGSVYITSGNSYTDRVTEEYPFDKQDWYVETWKADGDVAFISVHVQNYLDGVGAEVFSVARLIKDPDSRRPLGVIMADADTMALERMMGGIRLRDGSIAVILDNEKKLIYSSQPISDHMRQQLAIGDQIVNNTSDRYSVVSAMVNRSKWMIVVLSPESVIKAHLQRIYWVVSCFAAGGLLIAMILYFIVSSWMVTPFKRMIQVMKRVQRGDMHTFYPVKGNDEISQLGRNLNTMISTLGELIDREYKAVLNQRNAEYRALQSQIQPHFLYNTLNGFIGLNRTGQSMLLERAILSLSGMLRYTLEHNDWAQVREEMDFLAKYCELQQMRFGEKMQVHIACDPDASTILIPKLLLQPIIENAIIHGIEPSDRLCQLRIEVAFESLPLNGGEMFLIISICDDGVGFDAGREQEDIGISNVRERLRLAFVSAELNLKSTMGKGTQVRMQIPLKDVKRA
jgi:two-component system sensor histidine kinase YesM